ncbi:hypothetical protein KUCAC02_015166 [Chaenocephalus aceratus]|uniref:Uncharacterized protein n=1 Tax=Chaenocephalus aceratus TaxID=36190 RepID=A0ACB9XWJ1_CHAAC|nr:hypothetical protein KUCAC02_015166 [Chaenocephalus aceratus]
MLPTALEKHCSSASPMLDSKKCALTLFVHCANHSLDLVLQEVGREVSLVAETLNFVQGIATVIRESSKRKELYVSMFGCDDVVIGHMSDKMVCADNSHQACMQLLHRTPEDSENTQR